MDVLRTASSLSALRDRPRRLLAVFPHPDDESYGCAGAFARAAADPQTATVLLCLTRGEASSMGRERGLTPTEVGDLREERLERVAAAVKLDGLVVDGLPDGRLARLPLTDVAASVEAVLESFEPQVVIAHDPRGVNAHPDHIAAHWAVRRALEGRPSTRLAMVAYVQETCEAALPRMMLATPQEEIDATLHLAESEIEAKEACLRIHEGLVTLREGGDQGLYYRPPIEHFDFLGEAFSPPAADLFVDLRIEDPATL